MGQQCQIQWELGRRGGICAYAWHRSGLSQGLTADGRVFPKAWESFQKALQADGAIVQQAPSVPYNIAMSLQKINKPVEARKYLGMALDLDPGYEPARKLMESLS